MSFDDSQPQDVRFAAETLYRNVDRPPVNYNRYNRKYIITHILLVSKRK